MAGLKRLVGVTLAVILVTALVVYVLRPSATTTPSVVNEPGTPTVQPPPGDQGTCRDQPHGLYPAACHPSSGTGSGSGSGNDTEDDHGTGDHHSGHGHDKDKDHGHGHEWGESGDHDDDENDHGDHHSDHDRGESEHDDP